MTTEIEVRQDTPLSRLAGFGQDDQIHLKSLISGAREPTWEQVGLFVHHCVIRGLDPFCGQVFGIIRESKGVPKLTLTTSREGFRVIAERTQRLISIGEPKFDREEEDFPDDHKGHKHPNWARVAVKYVNKLGDPVKASLKVRWSEFYKKEGGFYDRMPWHMLGKVAEVHALRKAFPDQMAGFEVRGEFQNEPPIKEIDADVRDVPRRRASREELDNIRPLPNPIDQRLAKDLERKAATPEIVEKEQERAGVTS